MTAKNRESGFSLIEIIGVMMIIAILIFAILPNFRGITADGELSKAEKELETVRAAVLSYWKNHQQVYPANIHAALSNSSPRIIITVRDPFTTDTTNNTYGYVLGSDASYGSYFAIYTKGPAGDTWPSWDSTNQRIQYTGSGRVVSNADVFKQ